MRIATEGGKRVGLSLFRVTVGNPPKQRMKMIQKLLLPMLVRCMSGIGQEFWSATVRQDGTHFVDASSEQAQIILCRIGKIDGNESFA